MPVEFYEPRPQDETSLQCSTVLVCTKNELLRIAHYCCGVRLRPRLFLSFKNESPFFKGTVQYILQCTWYHGQYFIQYHTLSEAQSKVFVLSKKIDPELQHEERLLKQSLTLSKVFFFKQQSNGSILRILINLLLLNY